MQTISIAYLQVVGVLGLNILHFVGADIVAALVVAVLSFADSSRTLSAVMPALAVGLVVLQGALHWR
ncbi:MAG: hypothetical protein ACLQIJ_21265 [Polyangia bacterium]